MTVWFVKFSAGLAIVLIAGCQPDTTPQVPITDKNDVHAAQFAVNAQPTEIVPRKNGLVNFLEIPASAVPDSLIKLVEELCQGL